MKNRQRLVFAGPGGALMQSLFDAREFAASYRACFGRLPPAKDRFSTYLKTAANERIRPNAWFDESAYLAKYRDVSAAIARGDFCCGFQHWCAHGRAEGREPTIPVLLLELLTEPLRDSIHANFDQRVYELQSGLRFKSDNEAISHFLSVGAARANNPFPPDFFDEGFYRLYYKDVDSAVERGEIPSGLFHFLARGHTEGRSGWNNKNALITKKLGASAQVPALANIPNLERKLEKLDVVVDHHRMPRINLFVPSLDGNIMFGGYTAFLHFAIGLARYGFRLRFLVTEDIHLSRGWCLQTLSGSLFADLIGISEFENITSGNSVLRCSPLDVNIAYSTWAATTAYKVAQHLEYKRIINFVQEYEPVFHEHSSNHFLSNAAFSIPQVAIFNSEVLFRYFQKEKIGHFVVGVNSVWFEHSLSVVPPDKKIMRDPSRRRGLLCYARPEAHAARNLFEIAVLALRRAVANGVLDASWNIVGVGSLQSVDAIDLGGGCSMSIKSKLSFEEYKKLLQEYDVGLSLMWAPHPSVVPFEMAAAGIVSVTNTFSNRPLRWFKQFGSNIVPTEPTLEGIVNAIASAVSQAGNYEQRLLGARAIKSKPWEEVFNDAFVRDVLRIFDQYPNPKVKPGAMR